MQCNTTLREPHFLPVWALFGSDWPSSGQSWMKI